MKGKHEPIISEELFLAANTILKGNPQGFKHKKDVDELPLKQFLKCDACGTNFTGYIVRRKTTVIYYYKCNHIGCKKNRNAKYMHDSFKNLLRSYSVKPEFKEPLKETLRNVYYNLTDSNSGEKKALMAKLNELTPKIETIEERFALGEIERDIYVKMTQKLGAEKAALEANLEKLTVKLSNPEELIDFTAVISTSLSEIWSESDHTFKQNIQKLVFPSGLVYNRENDTYRTDNINGIFKVFKSLSNAWEE